MTSFKFRPVLEAMDERIVPTVVSGSAPPSLRAGDFGDTFGDGPSPGLFGRSDASLEAEVASLNTAIDANRVVDQNLQISLNTANARLVVARGILAVAPNAAAIQLASGLVQAAQDAVDDLEDQIDTNNDVWDSLKASRDRLLRESMRRRQNGPRPDNYSLGNGDVVV